MKTVYLSSTFEDLKEHRESVYRALRRSQYDIVAMEDYVARDDRMVDACLKDVANNELYIVVVARRYGFVPRDDNPDGLSITHLEYGRARAENKPVLVFLLDPEAPWDERFTDAQTGENDRGERIARFRADLDEFACGRFRDVAGLVENVLAAVQLKEAEVRRLALPQEIGSASSLTLMQSGVSEIESKIASAIRAADKPEVFHISLGDADRWWSTRLLLLAGLCEDYTRVERFAFDGVGKRFLGLCRPQDVHRALAAAYPEVETAYRGSRPRAGDEAPDPLADVEGVINRFSDKMDHIPSSRTRRDSTALRRPRRRSSNACSIPSFGASPAHWCVPGS